MDDLAAQSWFSVGRLGGSSRFSQNILHRLGNAPMGVSGLLAETTITIGELRSLSVGDMLITEKPASDAVTLCVEGGKKFSAHLGQFRGNRALRVIDAIAESDAED
jgi:flagellar motor switch protein FliM